MNQLSSGKTLISVIIPTVDRVGLLNEALESIANQHYSDVEVILANDGGPSLLSFAELWNKRFPLHLVESPRRQGPAAARNVAIENSSGEYVAFLDDDDIFLPQHLETAAKMLCATDADLVYLGAVVANRRMRSLPPNISGLHLKAYDYVEDFLLVANYIHTGSIVVRNFRDTNLRFDESLSVCEDWDMWIALTRSLHYRVAFVNDLTSIYHQVSGAQGMVAEAQQTNPSPFTRARERIHEKWPSGDSLVASYRNWMTCFESYRNRHIALGRPVPTHLFDRVLGHLHGNFTRGDPADTSTIGALFQYP